MPFSDDLLEQAKSLRLALQFLIRHGEATGIGDYCYLDELSVVLIAGAINRYTENVRQHISAFLDRAENDGNPHPPEHGTSAYVCVACLRGKLEGLQSLPEAEEAGDVQPGEPTS